MSSRDSVPFAEIPVERLVFTFATAGDDLRGHDANLNITVQFSGGSAQRADNANAGAKWPENSVREVTLPLASAIVARDIVRVELHTTSQPGVDRDNWDMRSMTVRAQGNGLEFELVTHGYCRFTGNVGLLAVPVHVPA